MIGFRLLGCLWASALLAAIAAAQAPAAIWIDVPFVAQPRQGCGAASLAMVFQYWAHQQHTALPPGTDVSQIQQALYSPKEHGIPASQMPVYLHNHGFFALTLHGQWADLDEQLRKGRPLIVALRPQGQPELHYVVIDGIDNARNTVTMNDPAERKLLTEERAGFEKDWRATGNWTLLAVPGARPD